MGWCMRCNTNPVKLLPAPHNVCSPCFYEMAWRIPMRHAFEDLPMPGREFNTVDLRSLREERQKRR